MELMQMRHYAEWRAKTQQLIFFFYSPDERMQTCEEMVPCVIVCKLHIRVLGVGRGCGMVVM